MKKSVLFALLLMFPLASCAHYTLVPQSEALVVNGGYTIRTEAGWNARASGNALFLTQYGEQLDSMILFGPIGDDEPLAANSTEEGKKMPRFKKGMSLLAMPDFLKESLLALGYSDVALGSSAPATMDGGRSIRIDLTAISGINPNAVTSGTNLKGFALAAIKNDKLHAMAFLAEETTYHPLVAPGAEKVLASIALPK